MVCPPHIEGNCDKSSSLAKCRKQNKKTKASEKQILVIKIIWNHSTQVILLFLICKVFNKISLDKVISGNNEFKTTAVNQT